MRARWVPTASTLHCWGSMSCAAFGQDVGFYAGLYLMHFRVARLRAYFMVRRQGACIHSPFADQCRAHQRNSNYAAAPKEVKPRPVPHQACLPNAVVVLHPGVLCSRRGEASLEHSSSWGQNHINRSRQQAFESSSLRSVNPLFK